METNKIEKVTPRGSQNILLHEVSKKYSVVFYTFSHYIVFQTVGMMELISTQRTGTMFFFGFLPKKKKNFSLSSVKKRKNFKHVWYIAHQEMTIKKLDENMKIK